MGESKVALQEADLQLIGDYVQSHLEQWIEKAGWRISSRDRELDLFERVVRVEEELKGQRDLLKQGFGLVQKQFEQVDKRFDQVDKRFTMLQWFIGTGFTAITVLMTVYTFLAG